MSSGSSSKSDYHFPVGKDLSVGCMVRLCHLTSTKGQELNQTLATIVRDVNPTSGRYTVQLIKKENSAVAAAQEEEEQDSQEDETISIKPSNLRKVCSSCHDDNSKLQVCSQCRVASYCNATCQKHHWKAGGHKRDCKRLKEAKAAGTTTTMGDDDVHPTWRRLPTSLQQHLKKSHGKCTVPWPLSSEPTALLASTVPCYYAVHPNMRFKASLERLPGGFCMSYMDKTDLHGIEGKTAPMGQVIPMLTEDLTIYDGGGGYNPQEYFRNVPVHGPNQLHFGIVAGHVLWTRADYEDFDSYYQTQKSPNFDWPGAECIGICPGTGKRVPYSNTDHSHMLVACELSGYVRTGGILNHLTRIMPRILTAEGYQQMMGRQKGTPNRLVKAQSWSSNSTGTEIVRMELYPDCLRLMGDLNDTTSSNTRGAVVNDDGVGRYPFFSASKAYNDFHASGRYKAFERLMDDRSERAVEGCKERVAEDSGVVLEVAPTKSGYGPSKY